MVETDASNQVAAQHGAAAGARWQLFRYKGEEESISVRVLADRILARNLEQGMLYALSLCGFIMSALGRTCLQVQQACFAVRWSLTEALILCVISGMPPFFGNERITGEDEQSLGTISFPKIADRGATNAHERAEDSEGTGPNEGRVVNCGGIGEQQDDILPVEEVLETLSRVARWHSTCTPTRAPARTARTMHTRVRAHDALKSCL